MFRICSVVERANDAEEESSWKSTSSDQFPLALPGDKEFKWMLDIRKQRKVVEKINWILSKNLRRFIRRVQRIVEIRKFTNPEGKSIHICNSHLTSALMKMFNPRKIHMNTFFIDILIKIPNELGILYKSLWMISQQYEKEPKVYLTQIMNRKLLSTEPMKIIETNVIFINSLDTPFTIWEIQSFVNDKIGISLKQ